MSSLTRLFSEHPHAVNETYLQHARVAAGFAWRLGLAALAALVHAVLPFLFERTARDAVAQLHATLNERH